MTVIAWIVEGTWPACVDAAGTHAPEGADIVLLHVTGDDVPGAAHGAYAGLFGRGRPERDPGTRLQQLAAASAQQLLGAAAERLGLALHPAGTIRADRAGSRRRCRRRRSSHPRPRRRPHPPGTPEPESRHPLRRRPRTLPGPAGLARDPAGHHHHPARASPSAAPARLGADGTCGTTGVLGSASRVSSGRPATGGEGRFSWLPSPRRDLAAGAARPRSRDGRGRATRTRARPRIRRVPGPRQSSPRTPGSPGPRAAPGSVSLALPNDSSA